MKQGVVGICLYADVGITPPARVRRMEFSLILSPVSPGQLTQIAKLLCTSAPKFNGLAITFFPLLSKSYHLLVAD